MDNKVMNSTGAELTPGDPDHCQGRYAGANCCCHKCVHFLTCFPEMEEHDLYAAYTWAHSRMIRANKKRFVRAKIEALSAQKILKLKNKL